MVKVNDHSLQHLIYTLVITYIYSNETYPLSVFVHYLLKNVNLYDRSMVYKSTIFLRKIYGVSIILYG